MLLISYCPQFCYVNVVPRHLEISDFILLRYLILNLIFNECFYSNTTTCIFTDRLSMILWLTDFLEYTLFQIFSTSSDCMLYPSFILSLMWSTNIFICLSWHDASYLSLTRYIKKFDMLKVIWQFILTDLIQWQTSLVRAKQVS